jgi:hypothetical protein
VVVVHGAARIQQPLEHLESEMGCSSSSSRSSSRSKESERRHMPATLAEDVQHPSQRQGCCSVTIPQVINQSHVFLARGEPKKGATPKPPLVIPNR